MDLIAPSILLTALIESSEDAIISQAVDGTILSWNRAAEGIFGYTAAEAIGRSIDIIVPPGSRAQEEQVRRRVLTGEVITHFETVAVSKAGAPVSLSLTVSPVIMPEGRVIGVSRIARDIAEHKRLEREAFRLAAIVDSSEDAIVSKDLNGIVQTWNKAAERMFGYPAAEMIGRSITTIIPVDRLHEEDHVLSRIRAGERVEHFETVRRRKDGGLVDISLSVSPIKTPSGATIGASKIARDVSRQRAVEREAFRLDAIVDSSEDAIISKDLDGIVRTWNRAAERMFGYSADEIVGRSILMIIPPDRRPEEEQVLARIRSGRSVEHFETVRRRKDGTGIDISLSVSPIRTPSGAIIGASKIARDITVQLQLARAAEEANRVKDEFLATLSHELRTPLNAVLGYTRLLRLQELNGQRQERAIDIIERNANMLSQLVSDVLDVSSIVTGKIRLKPQPCDLVPVLQASVDTVRPPADAKGVALSIATPDRPVRASGDSDRLQQAFWNVLNNAVKYTGRGGKVDVRLAVLDAIAELTVADTGIGIRPESLPYVFQRFWQGESDNRQAGGLGLGLALARHFVELHGGTIVVESAGENQGATFTIRLPLIQD